MTELAETDEGIERANDASASHMAMQQFPLEIARIVIAPDSPLPIYQQICQSIRTLVADGSLPVGTLLPTSRDLARVLCIGRNTVVAAYARLVAEGYLVSNTRRGTRVAKELPAPLDMSDTTSDRKSSAGDLKIGFHAREALKSTNFSPASVWLPAPHVPDPTLYPRTKLGRLLTEEFQRVPAYDSVHAGRNNCQRFQTAITAYLRHARGVICEPSQVIPTTGLESAADLVARVMIDPGHTVLIEDPGHECVRAAFAAAGARFDAIRINLGSDKNEQQAGPPPRLISVSSSVSFPFGAQMPEQNRLAVLEIARSYGAAVFENDTCSELLFSGVRSRAIQGCDRDGRVIYCGSLVPTLGPGIRAGYLVVPPSLAEAFSETAQRIAYGPEPFVLSALATFIEENHYAHHVQTIRSIYAERMNQVVRACRENMRDATILEPQGGFHLAIKFNHKIDERAVCEAAVQQGVPVTPLSRYYLENEQSGLVLQFSTISERLIEPVIRRLAVAVKDRALDSAFSSVNENRAA